MYGLIVAAGIFIAASYAEKEIIIQKKNPSLMWNVLLWVLIFGIIGARIYHVADLWDFYSQYPQLIFAIWKGGLGIFGGIAGGLFGIVSYSYKSKLSKKELLYLLDIGAASLPLGQFIGRWANYFNQELYGLPSTLPWAVYIRPENRLAGYIDYQTFHPLFLYESLGCLAIFFIIFALRHTLKHKVVLLDGEIALMYLSLYGILRFCLEFLRVSYWDVNGINITQLISLAVALPSIALLLIRK